MEKSDYAIEDVALHFVEEPKLKFASSEVNDLTIKIVEAAMDVYTTFGNGFEPGIYKECLCVELETRKIKFKKDQTFEVVYKGVKLPYKYRADIIVENKIAIGILAENYIMEEDSRKMINQLAASKKKVGLLLNFGESALRYKRIIHTSET